MKLNQICKANIKEVNVKLCYLLLLQDCNRKLPTLKGRHQIQELKKDIIVFLNKKKLRKEKEESYHNKDSVFKILIFLLVDELGGSKVVLEIKGLMEAI